MMDFFLAEKSALPSYPPGHLLSVALTTNDGFFLAENLPCHLTNLDIFVQATLTTYDGFFTSGKTCHVIPPTWTFSFRQRSQIMLFFFSS
jgi:hypothetical protein